MTGHTVDDCFAALHAARWSVGDTAALSPGGLRWLVTGTRGTHTLEARGRTQAEAWERACRMAEALGLLD